MFSIDKEKAERDKERQRETEIDKERQRETKKDRKTQTVYKPKILLLVYYRLIYITYGFGDILRDLGIWSITSSLALCLCLSLCVSLCLFVSLCPFLSLPLIDPCNL